jgi:uncharacterized repeat protein (TIGR01451 family)
VSTASYFPEGYEVGDRIGAPGGFGEVHEAVDSEGQRVALKVLTARDVESRRRFAYEARAAQQITDVGVPLVYDFDVDADIPWIASELVRGKTLDEVAPLTDTYAYVRSAVNLARILKAVHQADIAHRDLKPANVVYVDPGHLKVVDFGIALGAGPPLTEGASPATPGWAAPERRDPEAFPPLTGGADHLADEQCADVFSLALVLAYLRTGVTPFPRAELITDPDAAPDLSGADDWLRAALEPALVKDPHRRATLEELTEALRHIDAEHGHPPAPLPDSDTGDTATLPRRRRTLLAALALAAALALVTTAALWMAGGGPAADTVGGQQEPNAVAATPWLGWPLSGDQLAPPAASGPGDALNNASPGPQDADDPRIRELVEAVEELQDEVGAGEVAPTDRPALSVSVQVRSEEDGDWQAHATVAPGEVIDYLVTFKNTGQTKLDDVAVGFNLPRYQQYVEGSTTYANGATDFEVADLDSNNITRGGVDLGNYAPGANAFVAFSAEIDTINQFEKLGIYTLKGEAAVRPAGMGNHHASATVDVEVNDT